MDNNLTLKLLPNEYWWGGVARAGDQMPFSAEKPYKKNLYQNLDGNQGCPFLVSSKGRYIWSEEPFAFEFSGDDLSISEALGEIIVGEGYETLKGAYLSACSKHFPPSGRIPHELTFTAPQYNSWVDVKKYPTQESVLKYARDIIDNGMPPGVFMIDDFWYQNNGVWKWDFQAFPDPKAMIDELHQMGFLVMLWVSPWVTCDTRQFQILAEKDYLLKAIYVPMGDDLEWHSEPEYKPAVQYWWNGFSCVLDLSNPDAFAWFQSQLDELVEKYGVDGFKFDGGDAFRYQKNYASYAPRTPNGHCEDFGRAGLKYKLAEYRACWKLGGQHLLQRVRDKGQIWGKGGFADTLPTSIAHGLMGYPYTCPDMVGGGLIFPFEMDQELFIRWAQSATFFPIIQYSLLPNRVLDEEHLKICMEMIDLRMKLGPEILELAKHASKTGEPIMRHMAYEFPDEGMETVADQFMLGDRYMIAPVLNKGQFKRSVRFPKGKWKGDDGSIVNGPCEIEVDAPLTRIPWFTRIG
jgi:alpha-glucosidase (family GH31 glycosyl hydrolase)